MKNLFAAALLAVSVAGCGRQVPESDGRVDAIARDYVLLSLEIGEKEEGYIDAYYGPSDLQERATAEAAKLSLLELAKRTKDLQARVATVLAEGDSLDARRVRFLAAQLTAAATRLRMMQGEKLSFADEARGLFGVVPDLKPLESYDPVLAKIEGLVPGRGPLPERVEAFQNRFNIPTDRLKPVFDAAIAECKRRTLEHIALPKNESFTMSLFIGALAFPGDHLRVDEAKLGTLAGSLLSAIAGYAVLRLARPIEPDADDIDEAGEIFAADQHD
jgi:hypothetical protein